MPKLASSPAHRANTMHAPNKYHCHSVYIYGEVNHPKLSVSTTQDGS